MSVVTIRCYAFTLPFTSGYFHLFILARFVIETRGNGIIALRSLKTPKWYLNIIEDNLGAGVSACLVKQHTYVHWCVSIYVLE